MEHPLARVVAEIALEGLAAGRMVEFEGLGAFYPDATRGFRFEKRRLPRVFVAYVKEDLAYAERLFADLEAARFAGWLDERRLLPGQNWPRAIECAIETSDFFVACFSENSVRKHGGFQAELRYALDCARNVPLDDVFLMPVRLNPCRVPRSIQREIQYIDLFPDWPAGVRRLIATMKREMERRAARK